MKYPSSIDFHIITGYSTSVGNNGNREIIQDFSAKNSFNLEIEHRARCIIKPDGTTEATIKQL